MKDPSLIQILAASGLVTTCEYLCAAGDLSESDETLLRAAVARTRAAFDIQDRAENVVPFSAVDRATGQPVQRRAT